MADTIREEAIDTLKRLKTTHMGDFGWDLTGIEALDFAISDIKRVVELQDENKRLKESFLKLREEIEDQCRRDYIFAENETERIKVHEGTANGLQVAAVFVNKYINENFKRERNY